MSAGSASTRTRGRASEDLAASYLESRGLVVCARNVTLAGAELVLLAMPVFMLARSQSLH